MTGLQGSIAAENITTFTVTLAMRAVRADKIF